MSGRRISILLWAALVALPALAAPPAAPRDDDAVAVVNGVTVYRRAVRAIVQGTIATQESGSAPDAATVRRLATSALDSLIDFELLYQASQTREITISEAAIENEINRTVANFGDKKAFDEALHNQGLKEADLRSETRKSLAVNRLLEGEVFRDVRVTEDDVEQYYTQNKQQFQHPAQTRASHILIRLGKTASKAQKEAAKAKATKILELLRDGANFSELASTQSEDPGTAPIGGDIGFFAAGEMDDTFEKATATLQPGQLSGVVSSSYGFHIIKVTERRDAGYESLAEVQERVRAALLKTERRKRQAEFVVELRNSATIQYPSQL